ncbi:MAG: GNAT family N-acetyltransferase [Bacteroidota bacterium]
MAKLLETVPIEDVELGEVARLVAQQQERAHAASAVVPDTLADPTSAEASLRVRLEKGYVGRVALAAGMPVGVLLGNPEGVTADLPAGGFAIDASQEDPTQVLAELYGEVAPHLLAYGATRHYLSHLNTPAAIQAATDMGFARTSYCAIRPVDTARPASSDDSGVTVREGTPDDLEVIARLCMVEVEYRYVPPVYTPRPKRERTLEELMESHGKLRQKGGAHLIATLDGQDVGVLTLDVMSHAPALCPKDQPFIGSTATTADARGRGVGTAMVEAVLRWAAERDHHGVTVSFQPSNRVSRRFWLGAGFIPTGFWSLRVIPESYATPPDATT